MQILEVNDLSVSFTQYTSGLRQRTIKVIHGLHLSIQAGEVLAVVGSSGSGKSVLAHAIMGILPRNANINGTILYKGEAIDPARQAAIRGKEIAFIPQSVNYLDPLMQVGAQVRFSVQKGDPAIEQKKAFERYQLSPSVDKLYPFQLSGGMARRVLVSTATVSGARLVIADEPTPGLHPAVVQETLKQFRELADQGCAVLFITHDIESALPIADKVAVFYAGTTVEIASASDFSGEGHLLRHPYSKALWRALPQNEFLPIPGFQPHPDALPEGCLFAPRCGMATSECSRVRPEMRELRGGIARCTHAS
ncbi:ABC transporter ATP-binding protein [Paenibacillus planticolens]|uniref:Nickel import system ATP-binding protein NikD n=1 Tax=Paenibacillus planticolens TaxID=2654976 RepID=A0ABX1ZXM4_9BACL|nr:ABC transporter ATP-binding protein [Paenibacillus planticolens]NOV04794.1 ATP-binding cassette domain-containing protein [Paenibacillus planticolens]